MDVMGVMGIVADVSYEWSKQFITDGISPLYFALFYVSLVYIIFWQGQKAIVERSLALIVAIMAGAFILNFFILTPQLWKPSRG